MVYIVTHGLKHGARAGAVAALGITAGCFVHIFAAALGVSALIAASATAFAVLKWVGAAYLVYVGVSMLLSRQKPVLDTALNATESIAKDIHSTGTQAGFSLKTVFFRGFWTNALNPKVALFFLAFLPQFITPGAANATAAFLLLGLLFNFNGLWVNIGWALLAAWVAQRVATHAAVHRLARPAGRRHVHRFWPEAGLVRQSVEITRVRGDPHAHHPARSAAAHHRTPRNLPR